MASFMYSSSIDIFILPTIDSDSVTIFLINKAITKSKGKTYFYLLAISKTTIVIAIVDRAITIKRERK